MSELTEAQEQAIERVKEIMREHFDTGVFIYATDTEGDDKNAVMEFIFHGGAPAGIGLCELAKARLMANPNYP